MTEKRATAKTMEPEITHATFSVERTYPQSPAKVFKAGDTFYEPAGCLHRVSKSAAKKGKTRVLAVIVYPRKDKSYVIPEPAK